MTATDTGLPRWDPTPLFPALSSRQFAAALEHTGAEMVRLVALFDGHGVEAIEARAASADDVAALDQVLTATNAAMEELSQLRAYVASFVTTDSRDAEAQGVASELERHDATLRHLGARLAAWVAAFGVDQLTEQSEVASDHAHALATAAERAAHQMSLAEEGLYAELRLTGSAAWIRLHGDVTSQLTATVDLPDGRRDALPINTVRALASHPDEAVRRAAYDAELVAWPTVAVPLAAALNAIKGEANTLNDRRDWSDPLDASLFANAVDRPTFDAMQAAVRAALPDLRRFLTAKAALLGYTGGLRWWDLFAPAPVTAPPVTWADGTAVVRRAFDAYAPPLGAMAQRAFDECWVDAEPRDAKRGGAFCMPFYGDRSLVLMNWSDSFTSIQTLAHELGHAYHNVQLASRTALQRQLPMALAETASLFCETLVVAAGQAGAASDDERLSLLDVDLQGAIGIVVDIHSRFLFETEVFARRRQRMLSVGELCQAMLDAQAVAYAEGLDQSTAHPWMWAVKPHYYGSHFYNWPYTYGLLFGLGLYARYQDDPEGFRRGYDELLSITGMADAATLAARFGIAVRDEGFWASSLAVVRERVDAYSGLVAARVGTRRPLSPPP